MSHSRKISPVDAYCIGSNSIMMHGSPESNTMTETRTEHRANEDGKVYSQYCFDAEFGYKSGHSRRNTDSKTSLFRRLIEKQVLLTPTCFKNWFFGLFPILQQLSHYDIKTQFVADVVAGLTVGIMHIPQGMAYAFLAGLPPVYGLYTSFFPSLIYTFFGTSAHISLGTVAVVSLLTGSVRHKFVPESINLLSRDYNRTAYQETLLQLFTDAGDFNNTAAALMLPNFQLRIDPIPVVTALTFLTGLFQVALGMCHAGFMVLYMSDQLVAGYTTGAAVIILASQFSKLFGVQLKHRYDGTMAVFKTFRDVFLALPENINWITTAISGCCILTIGIVKVCINDRYKKKLRIPVPIDLIVIIIVTTVSYFCDLHKTEQVKIVHKVPAGFPAPCLPDFRLISKLVPDAFVIAIISYAVSISMAQMFAKRHRYRIDANQELYAYGFLNIIGSFFRAYPAAASVSRSSVQESAGSKTQITSIIGASLVLVIILWLGHLFEPLPLCVLSSVIVVALKSVFLQLLDLKELWRVSKVDCMIFVVAFLATVVFGATWGLLTAIVFAAFTIVVRSQRPKCFVMGRVPGTNLYKSQKRYEKIEEIPGVKVFRFDAALHFANAELFRSQLYKKIGIDFYALRDQVRAQERERKKRQKRHLAAKGKQQNRSNKQSRAGGLLQKFSVEKRCTTAEKRCNISNLPKYVIIDCGGFSYVDVTGINMLTQVYRELQEIHVQMLLANCNDAVREKLELSEFYSEVSNTILMLTVQDAVAVTEIDEANVKGTLSVFEYKLPHCGLLKSINAANSFANGESCNVRRSSLQVPEDFV